MRAIGALDGLHPLALRAGARSFGQQLPVAVSLAGDVVAGLHSAGVVVPPKQQVARSSRARGATWAAAAGQLPVDVLG